MLATNHNVVGSTHTYATYIHHTHTHKQTRTHRHTYTECSESTTGESRGNLEARKKTVFNRLVATKELIRETTHELLKEEGDDQPKPQSHLSLLEASKKIPANIY